MSRSIHFNDTEYANKEAMPPAVRAAFDKYQQEQEQAVLDELGALNDTPDAAPAAPAWGGPRAPGAVPAPVEFDPVTSLGPATAVHLHDGLRLLPNFGTPHLDVLMLYRELLGQLIGLKFYEPALAYF